MVEVARYYEDLPGHADKAVMLYHKASSKFNDNTDLISFLFRLGK